MIRWVMRTTTMVFIYLCVGTLFAEVVVGVVLANQWKVGPTQLIQMLAIAQGVDLFAIKEEAEKDIDEVSYEQVSYEEIQATRAESILHLQLREQALSDELDTASREQRLLASEMKRFKLAAQTLDGRLATLREDAVTGGQADVRAIVEGQKAKEAKEYIVTMLDNDDLNEVVILLAGMPPKKASDIAKQFITTGEVDKLYEVLTQMRKGYPESGIADEIEAELAEPGGGVP